MVFLHIFMVIYDYGFSLIWEWVNYWNFNGMYDCTWRVYIRASCDTSIGWIKCHVGNFEVVQDCTYQVCMPMHDFTEVQFKKAHLRWLWDIYYPLFNAHLSWEGRFRSWFFSDHVTSSVRYFGKRKSKKGGDKRRCWSALNLQAWKNK